MKETLFWDFDGTLTHCKTAWALAMRDALVAYGHEVDFDDVRTHTSHTAAGFSWHMPLVPYPEATGMRWWERLLTHYHRLYDIHSIPASQHALVDTRFRENVLNAERYLLYDDTLDTLARCEEMGYEQIILSNNFPELPLIVDQLGLGGYFANIVVSARIGYEKPHRAIFDYALEMAGHPQVCFMIGDNPAADIQGAADAGIPAILVHRQAECPAVFQSDTLAAIPEWLSTHG